MNSLPTKPDVCPLCQKDWAEVPQRRYIVYEHYFCSDCKLQLIVYEGRNHIDFNIYKILSNELEIWWNYNQEAFLWNNITQKFIMTFEDFIPPFDITLERLHKLMVFL